MLKPNKTFKLDKSTKSFLASISNKAERDSFKNAMIDAQLASEIKAPTEKKGN